jgi:iron(II)-dependent oxidoreductase
LATASSQLPAQDARSSSVKERVVALLESTRRRTLALVEPLSEEALNAVHDPLMSPIVWDLGHIANFEELWLVRRAGGCTSLDERLGSVYDPFAAPRSERGKLPYLRSEDCLAYMAAVRERALDCLERLDLSPSGDRLLAEGFVYELIARHERQHSETILQTLQIMTSELYDPPGRREAPEATERPTGMVLVPGGPFAIGAGEDWFAYDNERPQHVRELDPFWIDAAPVTNGDFLEFIEAGGYARREWWSHQGWQWRERDVVKLPRYWHSERDSFLVRSFTRTEPVDLSRPVCHLSWYEADAFARSRGKRLPTEAEWEKAASWDSDAGVKRRYPWGDDVSPQGRANLGQLAFGTAQVGAYPDGASACGAHQMAGDVWEWTATGFDSYEGFEAFPYKEYSEVFFGGPFKVLRGGSWATQPNAVTTSFRNWDHPDRRQIFSGFRCAQDAEPRAARG